MRTIKFRGKRVDNGEWVYGDLLHTTSVLNGTKTHHVLIGVDLELYEVHPETIGQFTGLHDKDGNEIYEGDVLKCYNGERVAVFTPCDGLKLQIIYTEPLEGIRQTHENWSYSVIYSSVKIGNIHDNPELTKEGEK